MIPKTIHLFWFSGDPYPAIEKQCIESWKKLMPGYQIKLWNKENFNLSSNSFVEAAARAKRWAFVTDYARLYALYTEGGIYLDADVLLLKSLDEFTEASFFSAVETNPNTVKLHGPQAGTSIMASVLGSIPGHPYIEKCLKFYDTAEYDHAKPILVPAVIANIADEFGFKRIDENQHLSEGIRIYRSEFFCNGIAKATKSTYAIHMAVGGWRSNKIKQNIKYLIKRTMALNEMTIKITVLINTFIGNVVRRKR